MRSTYLVGCLVFATACCLLSDMASRALALPPLSQGKDCICAPNSHTYGYYPAKWRRWPQQGLYGVPTPAMMQHGEQGLSAEPEQLPELLPPTNERAPRNVPQGPTTPADSPTDTLPDTLPDEPSLDEPADVTPPGNLPAAEPETPPATPSLPPTTPGALPEDPLAPPAELDDDPVPALPQSLLEPMGDEVPEISQLPKVTTPTRYQPLTTSTSDVDETGLPTLPLPGNQSGGTKIKLLPQHEAIAPLEATPEFLEPSADARPVDADSAGEWTSRRDNPLRGAADTPAEVQQAAYWQTTAPAKTAAPRSALPPAKVTPRAGVQPSLSQRVNPLRSTAGGQ